MSLCSEGAFFATSQKCVLVCLVGFSQERNMMQGFGLWFTQKTIKKQCFCENPSNHKSISKNAMFAYACVFTRIFIKAPLFYCFLREP